MRRWGAWVRCCCLVVLAVASALCVSGPALYWRYRNTSSKAPSSLTLSRSLSLRPFFGSGSGSGPFFGSTSRSTCAPCSTCDCPPPLSLHAVAPVLANLSITDCGKDDPDLHKELGKHHAQLLTEELKLHEAVAEEQRRHANATLADARRLASQYQHEVDKCNMATEACEEARERSAAALAKERKITALWERRAHQLGWHDA
ncbi:hypothetical protein LUZ63_008590 [Rhynchospora breviuscula]|uniref:Uncharacterized protein n=1 Tax=Rhynchospora breviuscula TaxID=2022672 RepID=A0A9Q0HW73_9POAL|nr:hypothetical protein LUZ63_008590 [Rhynchospora breviuscula]